MTGRTTFVALDRAHLPALTRWLNTPHVYEWWGVSSGPGALGGSGSDAATEQQVYEKYAPGLDSEAAGTRRYIITVDERAVGLLQWYPLAGEAAYAAVIGEFAPGDAGIDLFIGESDSIDRRVGSLALDVFVRDVVFAAPRSPAPSGPHIRTTPGPAARSKRPGSRSCATPTCPTPAPNACTFAIAREPASCVTTT